MNCTRCGAPLPEGSAFCNRCGAATAPSPVQPPPGPPANAEPESDLWKGRYSGKADAHLWVLWFAWVVALLYLWFGVIGPETRKFVAAPWIFASAAALPVLSLAGTLALRKLSVRYRLTTHRLFRETGVLLRRFNELELLRVDDVAVRQNLVQRIFNVGTVTVIAPSDATEPRVEMLGIEDPLRIKELIRTQVRKRRERSVYMESL